MAFQAYNKFGKVGDPIPSLEYATVNAGPNGWVENDDGRVVWGKKPAGTIDLTPKWRGVLPVLLFALEAGTDEGKRIAKEELQRMADCADAYNASVK